MVVKYFFLIPINTHLTDAVVMPREVDISLNERDFILRALNENVRLDGRSLEDFRPLEITFGEEYGVADVRLGKTR